MVKKITNNDLNEAKKGAAVVDFSAVWCGPCQMLAPVMEELSEELSGKAEFTTQIPMKTWDLHRSTALSASRQSSC